MIVILPGEGGFSHYFFNYLSQGHYDTECFNYAKGYVTPYWYGGNHFDQDPKIHDNSVCTFFN